MQSHRSLFGVGLLVSGMLLGVGCLRDRAMFETSTSTGQFSPATNTMGNAAATGTVSGGFTRIGYTAQISTELDTFDHDMDELDLRVKRLGSSLQNRYKDTLASLRDKRDDIEADLKNLNTINTSTMLSVRSRIDSSLAELRQSFANLKAQVDLTLGTES